MTKTTIIITNTILSKLIKILPKKNNICIITDDRVKNLYGNFLYQELKKNNFNCFLFSFPEGDINKSQTTKNEIEKKMFSSHLNRHTSLIALGGGVVSDLAGFIASTYYRGIDLITVPTTLLSMVDASIGGKNGINTEYGKNLIGTYYFPKAILIDENFLKPLPKNQILEGMAEVFKYSLITKNSLFKLLNSSHYNFSKIISISTKIKNKVIKKDPCDKHLRQILNFGHTIGHAIEHCSNYQITHGTAVFIGIVIESYISLQLNILKNEDFQKILSFVLSLDLKIIPISKEDLYKALLKDKKNFKKPKFIILKSIGKVKHDIEYSFEIPQTVLEKSLNFLIDQFGR